MGSYSMNCGLSGLEIDEQRACYVVMLKPSGCDWVCATAAIRGYYNDYGGHRVDIEDRQMAADYGIELDARGDWTPLGMIGEMKIVPGCRCGSTLRCSNASTISLT